MAHFIYSTLTASVNYTTYLPGGADIKVKDRHVNVKGGANNVILNTFNSPDGIVTEVSNEDMDFLLQHPVFQMHIKNGFITHKQKEIKIEKAIESMTKKDKSAQKVPADYEGRKKVKDM